MLVLASFFLLLRRIPVIEPSFLIVIFAFKQAQSSDIATPYFSSLGSSIGRGMTMGHFGPNR